MLIGSWNPAGAQVARRAGQASPIWDCRGGGGRTPPSAAGRRGRPADRHDGKPGGNGEPRRHSRCERDGVNSGEARPAPARSAGGGVGVQPKDVRHTKVRGARKRFAGGGSTGSRTWRRFR